MMDDGRRRLTVILLTDDEAARVRSRVSRTQAISPRNIGPDQNIVGLAALENPDFAHHIPFLFRLPLCEIDVTNLQDGQAVEVVAGSVRAQAPFCRVYWPSKGKQEYETPDLPEFGDWDVSQLYESVGRALTAWENYERSLTILFESLTSGGQFSLPARRAYGSVVSFNARREMVKKATEAFFYLSPDDDAHAALRKHLEVAGSYAGARNKIAHGVVGPYNSPSGPVRGLALVPAYYATNHNALRGNIDPRVASAANFERPKYAFTTTEIRFFTHRFRKLELVE